MKRIVEFTAVLVPVVLLGCATTSSQKGAMERLSDNREQMNEVRGQIDRTIYSLDSLTRSPPAEIKDAQERYAADVKSLRAKADALETGAKTMREGKIDYLTEWERAQLAVESPGLKRATEQRQKEVVSSLNSLEAALNDANREVAPLVAQLEDIERVTRNDPTPAGIAAVKRSGVVQSADKRAAAANRRLDLAASRFDRTLAVLSPQPGTRPASTASTPTRGAGGTRTAGVPSLPTFNQADRNASGAIERDEAEQVRGLDFQSADRDQDGKLSQSEYEAATQRTTPASPAAPAR